MTFLEWALSPAFNLADALALAGASYFWLAIVAKPSTEWPRWWRALFATKNETKGRA